MNRDTVTGMILIFAILIGYSIWMTPSQEEKDALQQKRDSIAMERRTQDSINALKILEKQSLDSIWMAEQVEIDPSPAKVTQIPQINRDKLGVFANSGSGKEEFFQIENDFMRLTVSSKGGKIVEVLLKEFQTFDSLPLILFDQEYTNFGITFFANNRIIQTNDLFFQANNYYAKVMVPEETTGSLAMRLYADAGDSLFQSNSYIEFLYSLKGNDYMLDFDISFVGMEAYIDRGTNFIDLHWSEELRKLEKGTDQFNGPTIYYKFHEDDVDYLSETKDDNEDLVNRLKWISFKHRFFSSTLIAKDYFMNAKIKAFEKEGGNDRYLRSMETDIGLPFNLSSQETIALAFYFGPNKFKTLRQYRLDLERQIPLGWSFFLMAWINRYAVLPVFNFLENFGWNYGIIILVLTILLKIVLFPIAYKSYLSSAKMRVLKPELEELAQKFPKKEDAMKKQQATMDLYRQAGVNPMAGCVPMLLQFPILIAMFRFFPSAFELRQQSFLWADDLSSYDSILSLPFNIPFYGDHVSLFTLLMTVSTILYTKVSQDMMGSAQQQIPGMKTMMYLMPIMFLGLFNNYASGLSYYYFLANIITFGQIYVIRMTIDESKIRKQIEINKKKPKKKSKWQERLESAAKQRGYKPSKK
jgi:YidC/Oxa1 family membrane protein insertase